MTTESLIHIRWHGKETVSEAARFISEGHNIEIDLPDGYHHACFSHLYPNADPDEPEFIDEENGDWILARIAEVAGLESIGDLREPVRKADAKVIFKSPPPRLSFELK